MILKDIKICSIFKEYIIYFNHPIDIMVNQINCSISSLLYYLTITFH